MAQITIEISDQVAKKLNAFLKEHPEETIENIIQDSLYIKQFPKDSSKILELAGIVSDAPPARAHQPEDF